MLLLVLLVVVRVPLVVLGVPSAVQHHLVVLGILLVVSEVTVEVIVVFHQPL